MVEINITTMSSKGQVVIPQSMRTGLKEGERFVIIKNAGMFILKRVSAFAKDLQGDIKFAQRAEASYREVESGNYVQTSAADFLKKVRKNAR